MYHICNKNAKLGKRVVHPYLICYNTAMANETENNRSRRSDSTDFLHDSPHAVKKEPSHSTVHKAAGSSSVSSTSHSSSSKAASVKPSSSGTSKTVRKKASSVHASSTTGAKHHLTKRQKEQRRKLTIAVLFLAFSLLLAVSAIIFVTVNSKNGNSCSEHSIFASPSPSPEPTPEAITDASVIWEKVTVNGVSLNGKTVAQARELVKQQLENQIANVNLTVAYNQYSMVLTSEKLGMSYDEDALEDILEQAARASGKADYSVPLNHSEDLLRESLAELNDQIPNHATNAVAEIRWKTNKVDDTNYLQPVFKYTDGVNGMAVDTDEVIRLVENALAEGRFDAQIQPNVIISEPAVTTAILKKRTTLLSSFTTTYRFRGTSGMDEASKLNCESRDINISKAVDLMKVIQLAPGKTFSYNKATGSRTEKNGWALANAIYQGSHRPEPGGGVCQLSTTMYNALLMANIKISARRNHSIPVDYVDDGWDATVDDGHIDFKFTNNTNDTLYVFCYITKNKSSSRKKDIHVEVYGTAFPDGTVYKKRSELVEILPFKEETIKDKTMYVSDAPIVEREGRDGSTVNTFIDMYVNGSFVKTVYSATTTYEPISKQTRIGTKADPTAAPVY